MYCVNTDHQIRVREILSMSRWHCGSMYLNRIFFGSYRIQRGNRDHRFSRNRKKCFHLLVVFLYNWICSYTVMTHKKNVCVFIFFVSWKNEFVVHDRNDVSIECVCSLIKMLVQIWNCYFFDVKLRFYMSKYTIIVSSCFEVSISLNQKFVTKEMYLSPFISNDHHLIYV